MAAQIIGIRVSITRYIDEEPQPGTVECEFIDAFGQRHIFVEKTVIVSGEDLVRETSYPQPGVIACEIIARGKDADGNETAIIGTEKPDGVESIDGAYRFEVRPSSLVTWDWGSDVERPWNDV